ncbi:MAG: DUF1772 domain-containing protein, partial [Bacteroidota bacterium]
ACFWPKTTPETKFQIFSRHGGVKPWLICLGMSHREILNPAFFLIFFGSPIALAISSIQYVNAGLTFWLILAATAIYLVGTFGVTVFGNVPLNDSLEALDLATQNETKLSEFRKMYEGKWNKLHTIRTVFSVISFMLSVLGIFAQVKSL